jgi:MerR family mercuric resistance operon transcriptional regulator
MNKIKQQKLDQKVTIGALAKLAAVGIDTVRFYERRGLLPAPGRTTSGYRLYTQDSVARIHFIRRAKRLGFTLDEIQTLLRLQDQGGAKAEVRELTRHKLIEIDTRIRDLERIRSVLQELARSCSGKGNVDSCPIIEAIAGTQAP